MGKTVQRTVHAQRMHTHTVKGTQAIVHAKQGQGASTVQSVSMINHQYARYEFSR